MQKSHARRKIAAPTPTSQENSGYVFEPCPINLPVTFEGKVITTARLEKNEYVYELPLELEGLRRQGRLLTEFVPQAVEYNPVDGHAVLWATVGIQLKRSWEEPEKEAV